MIWGSGGGAVGGGLSGAIATALMEGSTLEDVGGNFVTGVLGGLTGSGIAGLMEGAMMNSMRSAAATGAVSGMVDAVLMDADPVFGAKSGSVASPCK